MFVNILDNLLHASILRKEYGEEEGRRKKEEEREERGKRRGRGGGVEEKSMEKRRRKEERRGEEGEGGEEKRSNGISYFTNKRYSNLTIIIITKPVNFIVLFKIK
jgi:hypothetical protein